jgi:hypothetical protein
LQCNNRDVAGALHQNSAARNPTIAGQRYQNAQGFVRFAEAGWRISCGRLLSKPGAGTSVAETLHRSDEALVKSEIEAAGFKLIDQAISCTFPRMPVMCTRIAGQNRSISSWLKLSKPD